MLRGLEVLRLGRPGLSVASGAAVAPAVELFPGWTAGRVFSWPDDPSDFTITNYTTTTDGGQPALVHTVGQEFNEVSIITTASDIAHARVAVEFRAAPASGLSIVNISMKPQVRYQDASNFWQVARDFGDGGASWMNPLEKVAGSNVTPATLNGDTTLNNTDETNYQWIVFDVFRDVLRGKTWFSAATEPTGIARGSATTTNASPTVTVTATTEGTFQKGQYLTGTGIASGSRITNVSGATLTLSKNATASATVAVRAESFGKIRLRPAFGFGGSLTTDVDNTTWAGKAGLRAMYGGIIRNVIVTELVPASDNLLFGPWLDPELRDSSNRPYFWGFDALLTDQAVHGICEVVNTTGPGAVGTVPVLRAAKDSPTVDGLGVMWTQDIYRTDSVDNAVFTRDRPTPTVGAVFPASLDFSCWTKGTGLANVNPGTKLTARITGYYVDATGFAVNTGFSDYHIPLGDGIGTWDWKLTTWTLPIHSNTDIVRLELSLGLHDDQATGELLIYAPELTQ